MSDSLDAVNAYIQELQEKINEWFRKNSQSDPGAVMELRVLKKALIGAIAERDRLSTAPAQEPTPAHEPTPSQEAAPAQEATPAQEAAPAEEVAPAAELQ